MKYTPNAVKFGTQSRLGFLILNMIFENCGSWPETRNFYEIRHLVQIEHANYEYSTSNWWSWTKIIDSRKFGRNTEICSDFYEIWHSQQIEHANYEYNTPQCLKRSRDY